MTATIVGARIAAAHDGHAELVVELRFENGGVSEVTLDEVSAEALMQRCSASDVNELMGRGWEDVKEALSVSYNRFQSGTPGQS